MFTDWYRSAAGGPPVPRPLQSRAFWRALPAPDAGTPVAAAHRAAAALRPGMCVPPPDQEPPAGGWEPAPPRGRFAALLACLRHVLMYPWPNPAADRALTGHPYLRRLARLRGDRAGWLLLWPWAGLILATGRIWGISLLLITLLPDRRWARTMGVVV